MKFILNENHNNCEIRQLLKQQYIDLSIKIPEGRMPCGISIGIILHSKFCDFSFSKLGISFTYKSTTLSFKDVI